MANKDYYEILGVSKDASADEIKSAYRRLAKKYHPDINKEPNAATKFKEINEAYEVLGDDKKRSNYDQFGSADGQGFNFGGGAGGFNFTGDFGDIFGDIFSHFGGGRTSRVSERGEDIEVLLTISFEEAVFGVTKEINISRIEKCDSCNGTGAKNGKEYSTCSTCGGSGRVRYQQNTLFGTTIREGVCKDCNGSGKKIKEKCTVCGGKGTKRVTTKVNVKVPAGIDNGQTLRIIGEGNAPLREGTKGDLLVNIRVTPHKSLVRKGIDIYLDLYVPFTTLLLGGKVDIPTINGKYTLEIKELTQSGTIMRLKNKGIKQLNREYYGDMLVTLKSEAPKSLDRKTKEKLQEIEKSISNASYPNFKRFLDSNK